MKIFFLVATVLFFGFSIHARSGGVDGGGGRAIICRNADNTIRSAEVLDLYEGRVQYLLNYKDVNSKWTEQIDHILLNSGWNEASKTNLFTKNTLQWISHIKSNMRFLPQDASLTSINDSHEAIAPIGCTIEQAVNYINDSLILFDGNIWNSFSETQKAALIMHEAIYRELREYPHQEKDSIRARHFNAYLFSGGLVDSTVIDLLVLLPPEKLVLCSGYDDNGKYTQFQVTSLNKDNQTSKFFFQYLNGRTMLTRTTLEINYVSGAIAVEIARELINPSHPLGNGIYLVGQTKSAFESGDRISLSISQNADKTPRVTLHGRSALDNSTFDTALTCK